MSRPSRHTDSLPLIPFTRASRVASNSKKRLSNSLTWRSLSALNFRIRNAVPLSFHQRGLSAWTLVASFLLVFLLAACARSPKNQAQRLPITVPKQYQKGEGPAQANQHNWLADFNDPRLLELVESVQASNFDLQAAAARLETATANQRITRSARFPSIDGTFSGSRQKNNFQNLAGSIGTRIFNNYNLNARIAWEADLWGKVKNRTQAAIADVEAEQANYQAFQFSLAANALRTWFDTVEAELQLQLAQKTLSVFEQNLKVVQASFERGLPDRALDVRLTRANVENARSTVALRKRFRDSSGRALEALLGRYPNNELDISTDLPSLILTVPPGLPSELLHRRPDLRSAERQLAAALERVKIAKKDLLPTISLSSSSGTSSGELRDVLDPDLLIWNLAGNIGQPIFQGGRLLASIDAAKANSQAALATYAQTALNAFQEVESLLAAEHFLLEELQATQSAATESVAAETLAWQQYQRGLVDIITVLESQRRAFTAQSSLLTATNNRLANRINL